MAKANFETETCGRCGGTGSYSYNQIHGTTCYGCGGGRVVYTKRGAAAVAKFNEMRQRAWETLKVGDKVVVQMSMGAKKSIATIMSLSFNGSKGSYTVDGKTIHYTAMDIVLKDARGAELGYCPLPQDTVTIADEDGKYRRAALRYQATLNIRGDAAARIGDLRYALIMGSGRKTMLAEIKALMSDKRVDYVRMALYIHLLTDAVVEARALAVVKDRAALETALSFVKEVL